MKTIILSGLILTLFIGPPLGEDLLASRKSLYKAPEDEQLAGIINKYRNDGWQRVSGLNKSALHWHQTVITFIKGDDGAYRHNHKYYLKELNEDYDDESEIVFKEYPVGTQIVKENYYLDSASPPQPLTATIMVKREPGYAPKTGDWQYAQISPDGTVILSGNGDDPVVQQMCVSCHGNIGARDYVFATHFSSSGP